MYISMYIYMYISLRSVSRKEACGPSRACIESNKRKQDGDLSCTSCPSVLITASVLRTQPFAPPESRFTNVWPTAGS